MFIIKENELWDYVVAKCAATIVTLPYDKKQTPRECITERFSIDKGSSIVLCRPLFPGDTDHLQGKELFDFCIFDEGLIYQMIDEKEKEGVIKCSVWVDIEEIVENDEKIVTTKVFFRG